MMEAHYGRLCHEAGGCVVLAKVEEAAQELAGGTLVLLLRRGDKLFEVHPSGREATLPNFCEVYRTTSEGRKRCLTCRSLMTFGACYRELIDYTCHGGVSIIAAAAPTMLGDGARPVVASCAFATEDRAEGWQQLRDHARDLGVDLGILRRAYDQLPQLTDERRRMIRALVGIAAGAIGEIVDRLALDQADGVAPETGRRGVHAQTGIEHVIGSSLYIARDQDPAPADHQNGATFAQLVTDMVIQNPEMPFSVDNIARAARMTPNHFSTVFRNHTGQTFSAFLAEKRISLAKNLLRDLTLNVSEVASRAGFRDSSYFIRRFKQRTGMTPMVWRNSL